MKQKIVVFGSVNLDTIIKVDRLPSPHETVLSDEAVFLPGGKGANQAVAASRMGIPTYFIGAVGNDHAGKVLLKNLKKEKVKTDYCVTLPCSSGAAYIPVDSNGGNMILVVPGANGKLLKKHVQKGIEILAKDDIVISQFEIPMEIVSTILSQAKKKKAVTILNPSPIQEIPKELLTYVDYLIMNEHESERLFSITKQDLLTMSSFRPFTKLACVIVTLGKEGAIHIEYGKTMKHTPPFVVQSIDSTAAGDAFLGAFAATMLTAGSRNDAMKFGCAAGALAATKYGAQASLPTKRQIITFIAQAS